MTIIISISFVTHVSCCTYSAHALFHCKLTFRASLAPEHRGEALQHEGGALAEALRLGGEVGGGGRLRQVRGGGGGGIF